MVPWPPLAARLRLKNFSGADKINGTVAEWLG
jgi:hypothetical protein